ncbi:MAG: folate-binding protein [Acidobacteriota bacterium]|nr:folate-binding protein [Acidobacteriota bacterium]
MSHWLDVSRRGKIKVTGEDRARLLHAMTTNHIQQLTPGTGCYAFFLSAQGRILADANIFCRSDHFLLDTEPETREKLYQHLDKFIIADDVTLEDVTEATVTIALEGELRAAGAPVPEEPYANAEWGRWLVARLSYTGGTGYALFAPIEDKAELVRQLGASEGSAQEFEIARLENGKPRYGQDISERYLAQEVNQPSALHFSKGCYLGQEIVERVRSRGQVHRVLMPVALETQVVPAPGTKLQVDGKDVAELTSAGFSPALNKVVGLAYVRMEYAKPGTELQLAETKALVR